MGGKTVKVRYLPLAPLQFLKECGHMAMTVYWSIRLLIDGSDTKPTYMYCWHLDRTTFFRSRFQAWLYSDPARVEFWTRPRMFIDVMPDPTDFKDYPKGTVGRAYYEMCRLHKTMGLLDLRSRRLECLPDERKGLDLKALRKTNDPEDLYERIVARRNIFMTSTHDLCHMLTGSNTGIDGEAYVASYQDRHLLVPQNWMNMLNCMIVQFFSFRWKELAREIASLKVIRNSRNYAELDFSKLWRCPLVQVRKELGLPAQGFTEVTELAP